MLGCPPRWGTSESQMVHFSAIATIYKEKVEPFPAIIRGTFVLTNIFMKEQNPSWLKSNLFLDSTIPFELVMHESKNLSDRSIPMYSIFAAPLVCYSYVGPTAANLILVFMYPTDP